GLCLNGLKCPFKHDPARVAICHKFLNDDCTLPTGTCPLSHTPTPERVPVCVHFANAGRCRSGASCKYPHIRLGHKTGVCRDFAVLGYCAKGVDCPHQHVRECPDFAENGLCSTQGCRLPHVIRAQHKGQLDSSPETITPAGDDFIALTFDESSEEEEVDEDDNEGGQGHVDLA
ncbi:hypothetical protein DL93DRAFT_2057156, partial [Clavulina sp. PMI_390]